MGLGELICQTVALTLPSLTSEFGVSSNNVRYTTCATFIGLCIGASFWGIASDIVGRRLAFNMTLFLAGVFGLAVGGGPSWIGTCGLYAALGVGVGGNLPVDGVSTIMVLPVNPFLMVVGALSRVRSQCLSRPSDASLCLVAGGATNWILRWISLCQRRVPNAKLI